MQINNTHTNHKIEIKDNYAPATPTHT